MNYVIMYILSVIIIVGIFLLYRKISDNKEIQTYNKIDRYTDKAYYRELNKMISYYTIYMVDSKYGESFTSNKGVFDDVSIGDLDELKTEIVSSIINSLSTNMKLYFFSTYGERWTLDFINISVLSLLINYTNLTIKSLVELK